MPDRWWATRDLGGWPLLWRGRKPRLSDAGEYYATSEPVAGGRSLDGWFVKGIKPGECVEVNPLQRLTRKGK